MKKKILSFVIAVCMVVTLLPTMAMNTEAAGTGTANDPIVVYRNPIEDYAGSTMSIETIGDFYTRESTLTAWREQIIDAAGKAGHNVDGANTVQYYVNTQNIGYVSLEGSLLGLVNYGYWFGWGAVKSGTAGTDTETQVKIVKSGIFSSTDLVKDLVVKVKGFVNVGWDVDNDGTADYTSGKIALNRAISSDSAYEKAVEEAAAYAEELTDASATYTFAGWDTDGDGTVDIAADGDYFAKTIDVTSANDCLAADTVDGTTFTAVYDSTVNTYTVLWANNDGTPLETDENVAYGTTPSYDGTTPVAADKADGKTYTFTGWTPAVSDVTGDVTYTAVYSVTTNTYTITWVNDDGTPLETDENVAYGTIPSYDGATPVAQITEAGKTYTFTGWDSAIVSVTGDKTYKATYTTADNVYTVTFDADGGTAVAAVSAGHGETVSEPSTTKDGYRFDCWTLDGEEYDFSTPVTDNITLVAKWVQQVTVTFNTDGGTAVTPQTFDLGDAMTKPADPVKAGYVFNGWYVDQKCEEALDFSAPVVSDVIVYADWLALYTVTFDANGGLGDAMDAQTFTEGTAQALTANTYEPNGYYTFIGWSTSAVATTAEYTDKAEITPTANMTLYAVWEKIVIPTEISLGDATVEVTYGAFDSDDLLALIQPTVMANNAALADADVTIDDITANDAGTYTVTITYAGEDPYTASSTTATVVVEKAIADVVVKSQTVKYGEDLVDPIKANCDTIDVAAGIDGHDETYLVGTVQISLPDNMMILLGLAGYDEDRLADLTIDELKTIFGAAARMDETVGSIVSSLKDYTDTIEKLIDTLKTIQDELPMDSELVISVVSEVTMPENVGVYLIGSIAADSNYEAVEVDGTYSGMDAGYLIITPNGIKAELTWNETDDNDIITLGKLSRFDLGTTAAIVESTVEGATHPDSVDKHVEYLFVGVDEEGELLLDRTTDPKAFGLDLGVYAQVAYVANWDNVMYYAEPIARPIIVAPNVADVAILDVNGNENYAQVFTYDGTPKSVTVTVDGEENVEGLTVEYIGSDTTVDGWYRTDAPTDAGVYTIVATYTQTGANGKLVKAGGAVGVMVIEPADIEVGLEDATYTYDGNQYFATITNPALDYITIAIDRDENIAYVNLPEDTEAHIDRIVEMLPAEVETEVQAVLEQYADFDGDVQTSTIKAELTDVIEALIAVDMSEETVTMAKELVDQLAAELENSEEIQTLVDELQAQLDTLEEELRGQIPDDMEATLEDYIRDIVTVNDGVDIDVDKVKEDLKDKIAEVEAELPAAVVAELYEMADEVIAVLEANVDVEAIEAEIDKIVEKVESLEAVDAETVVKYILGAAYGAVDMSQVEELLTEVVEKVEARGYVEYLVNMAESIAGMYGGDIDTTEVTEAVEAFAEALEAKLQSGTVDSDDLEALETYVDAILEALLSVIDQIPEGTIIFGQNPSEVGVYDCYAINISANYKAEFVEAVLEIVEPEEEPVIPDDPEDPVTPVIPESPKTGDLGMTGSACMVLLIAACAVLLAAVYGKRKLVK